MRPIALFAVALPLVALVGCSSAGQQDLETAKDRIRELQRENAASERKIEELERRLDDLEQDRESAPPSQGAGAVAPPPPPEADTGGGPVTRIEIEESDLDDDSARRAGTAPAAGAAAPRAASAPGGAAGAAVTPEGQALYDRGYTYFHEGRYLDAETTFQQFLQAQGESELADNAQYWIGECRWGRKDYQGAMNAFRETVERYPDGNKVPDALLKVGQSLEQLGDTDGARLTYDEVVRRFPSSRASAVAADRKENLP